jgi:cytochrome c1
MKKIKMLFIFTFAAIGTSVFVGCMTSRIANKSGTTLWAENCARCHNSPTSSAFGSEKWEVIGMHMQVRANLTDEETKKIIEYLKSAE